MLREGVLRSAPHAPSGALPFPGVLLIAIMDAWEFSPRWWERMTAIILLISFISLLRGAGILTVPANTVTWILGLTESMTPPRPRTDYTGVLLLVPARKSRQSQPSWVPVKRGRSTDMLARFVRWRSRRAGNNKFLFPSRSRRFTKGRLAWVPHHSNRLSQGSFVTLMRQALMQVCGMSEANAKRFTLHSLRVGGINYYKRIGVPIRNRAAMASHKSIETSRGYLRMLPSEQIREIARVTGPHWPADY